MSEKNYTHSIELLDGFTDKDGKTHTEVTFGKRLSVGDLMMIEDNPQSQFQTQHTDLIRRQMMTRFGTMKLPVTLATLLSLNRIDRRDLAEAADHYVRVSRGERTSEFLSDNKVKLYFGFEVAGEFYDVVQFGNNLNGHDEVEADRLGLTGMRRLCFDLGKQISRLESSEHEMVIEGKVELDAFEKLDGDDLNVLRIGGEMFTQSFRLNRKKLSKQRNGDDSVSAGSRAGMDGKGNSKSAEATN